MGLIINNMLICGIAGIHLDCNGLNITSRYSCINSYPFSITDAFNETKDKVKYLESLYKYFDQLVVGNSLVNICNNTLPGLMASVRQMDAISRYYARNGYLGLLFSKVRKLAFCQQLRGLINNFAGNS